MLNISIKKLDKKNENNLNPIQQAIKKIDDKLRRDFRDEFCGTDTEEEGLKILSQINFVERYNHARDRAIVEVVIEMIKGLRHELGQEEIMELTEREKYKENYNCAIDEILSILKNL